MPVVSPPSVTPLPTPPSTASPSTFDSRADAFLGALPTFQTENNALAANVFANATDAAASAASAATQVTLATAQATAAAGSASVAGATLWVSGTTYALGDARYSPINLQTYRRSVAGAGTTDPSLDPTNWTLAVEGPTTLVGKTLQAATFTDGYTEEVFAVTGTTPALSPTNGSIQTWTLSANSTPTAGTFADGQSLTLMVDDGAARTITWTSLAVTWKTGGGTAPTLNTSGFTAIQLWKIGGVIYGARVGDN